MEPPFEENAFATLVEPIANTVTQFAAVIPMYEASRINERARALESPGIVHVENIEEDGVRGKLGIPFRGSFGAARKCYRDEDEDQDVDDNQGKPTNPHDTPF